MNDNNQNNNNDEGNQISNKNTNNSGFLYSTQVCHTCYLMTIYCYCPNFSMAAITALK